MPAPLFIGDEISAAGFRLAGVRIRTPGEDELQQVLTWARNNATFIMITSDYLSLLGKAERDALLRQEFPPVVEVPDMRTQVAALDLAHQFRSKLGVLE